MTVHAVEDPPLPGAGGEPTEQPKYGAAVTRRQYLQLVVALMMGTLIEWYDFTVYSQLANVLTQLFFLAKDATTAQLSFWGVYAVGFISRPLGSVIFGHIGDTYGRRITMLLSVAAITVPSILIGCLPTFSQAGIVAPILMAILRFVQGLAVGGEFGSAVIYLFELAPVHRKGFVASLGQMAIAPGIVLGILVVQILCYACPEDHLKLWGWRLPFLLTVFTGPIALVLRMHMPEPTEYLASRQSMVLQRVTSAAAARVARSFLHQLSRDASAGAAAGAARRLSARQVSLRLQALGGDLLVDIAEEMGDGAGPPSSASPLTAASGPAAGGKTPASGAGSGSGAAAAAAGGPAAAGADARGAGPDAAVRQLSRRLSSRVQEAAESGAALGCEAEYEAEVQQVAGRVRHHVPLFVLFRHHWRGVVLQMLMEAGYGAGFYTFFSWVAPYLQGRRGISVTTSLWAALVGMVMYAVWVMAAGHFIGDGRAPKVWSYVALTAAAAGLSAPALLWLDTGSMAALFVALPLMLALLGTLGGLMTVIGPQIFPAAVRATGYNVAHNLAMTIFGGLCPLMITATSVRVAPPALAAAVVLVATAGLSLVAATLLTLVVPHLNARCPVGAMRALPSK